MPARASVAAKVAARVQLHRSLPPPERCRELRKAGGLTLEEFGAIIGVTRSCVHSYETGRRTPRGERLARYIEAINALREMA